MYQSNRFQIVHTNYVWIGPLSLRGWVIRNIIDCHPEVLDLMRISEPIFKTDGFPCKQRRNQRKMSSSIRRGGYLFHVLHQPSNFVNRSPLIEFSQFKERKCNPFTRRRHKFGERFNYSHHGCLTGCQRAAVSVYMKNKILQNIF